PGRDDDGHHLRLGVGGHHRPFVPGRTEGDRAVERPPRGGQQPVVHRPERGRVRPEVGLGCVHRDAGEGRVHDQQRDHDEGDVGDADAPLNPAVPYLYAHLRNGYSLSYGSASAATPGIEGTFAMAPGDGTIYAGVKGLPVFGDLAIGVSTEGYLPFTPDKIPA